jgi:hypothetical protein
MAFGNRDLLTKVLPQSAIDAAQLAKYCLFRTNICRWPSLCHISCVRWFSDCGRCSMLITQITGCQIARSCGAGGSACDPTDFCFGSDPYVIRDLEDLVTIRSDLMATMKALDAIEKEGIASGITTKQEADQLEQTLKQQLEHVKKVREGLK